MEDEILDRLGAVLRGEQSLEQFRAWLSYVVIKHSDAPQLAHEIEYLIDEAIAGAIERDELRERLAGLAATGALA